LRDIAGNAHRMEKALYGFSAGTVLGDLTKFVLVSVSPGPSCQKQAKRKLKPGVPPKSNYT